MTRVSDAEFDELMDGAQGLIEVVKSYTENDGGNAVPNAVIMLTMAAVALAKNVGCNHQEYQALVDPLWDYFED